MPTQTQRSQPSIPDRRAMPTTPNRNAPLSQWIGKDEKLILLRKDNRMIVIHLAPRLPKGWRNLTETVAKAIDWPINDGYLEAESELAFLTALFEKVPVREITIQDVKRS